MKKLIDNYAFDATNKTITILCECNITLDKLLMITNSTDNIIIYNFADVSKGATIDNNVITLEFDTTAMSNTDVLQIWVYDTQPQLVDFSLFFASIRNIISRLSFDSISRLRVYADAVVSINANQDIRTVASVTTANTGFGDSGKYATQQLISQNIVSNSYNRNITRS